MNVVAVVTAALMLAVTLPAWGQATDASTPTPLSQLLAEAQANNPQISAADHEARAARWMAPQATTLPASKLTYQQLSVGSPKPFAGYTNSDFAYIGLGASQELPYPGKLRLRGEAALRNADTKQAAVAVIGTSIADAVKTDYLQLAYLQQTLGILSQNETILDQLIQDATAHYRVGQGMQQDVLEAQLRRTSVVHEITMHHQQMWQVQAHLKGLLNRSQQSPDIVTEDLAETQLQITANELLSLVQKNNPLIREDGSAIQAQDAQLASAQREGKPDFELAYMYQNTDRKYRDYYVFTFNVSFPHKKQVKAQIAEAQEQLIASEKTRDAHMAQQLAQVQQLYIQATSDAEQLKEYRAGLIPQADATYRATLSAYAANKEQFARVVLSFTDLLTLKLDEEQTLLDHEIALANLESLTGATLR